MKILKEPKFWVTIILFVAVFIATCILSLGCEVTKHRQSFSSDSTALHKTLNVSIDTSKGGGVKKELTNSKENWDWWKTTLQYQPQGDTNIINNYTYPSTIVYEGGKGSKESTTEKFDSSWFNNAMSSLHATVDSLSARLEQSQSDTHRESKGFGWLTLLLIAGGAIAVNKGMSFLSKRYKIEKRV